jgi:hypothetical protein
MEAGAGAGSGAGWENSNARASTTTRRYFEGELRSLRDKLGEKDVSLAKASRIQKELRWSLELYHRELSVIRGGGGSQGAPQLRDSRADTADGRFRSPAADLSSTSTSLQSTGTSASTHDSALAGAGETNPWYSPLPARNTARPPSLTPESPAPLPPPRRKATRQGAVVVAGTGRRARDSSLPADGGRRRARASRSSSSSSPSSPAREPYAAQRTVSDADRLSALLGAENSAHTHPHTHTLTHSHTHTCPGGVHMYVCI